MPNSTICRLRPNQTTRQTSQARQTAAQSRKNGCPGQTLAENNVSSTRQDGQTTGLCSQTALVRRLAYAGPAGHQPRPQRQRERRLPFYDGCEHDGCRSPRMFQRLLANRGYIQKYQTIPGWSGTAGLQRAGIRTGSRLESVAVFDHMAVVSSPKTIAAMCPWYTHKTAPSFADVLRCLRCQLWMDRFKLMFDQFAVHDKKFEFLVEALASAA